MPRQDLTVDELVAALGRSQLPTVIVEGQVDIQIYRWIEESISNRKVDIQSAGGRNNLLLVYKRRDEFAHLPVAFVADRDLWLFSGIPPGYPDIIWTEGYSIENDLYAGANLENLLNVDEVDEHRQVLEAIIEWFAFEVEEHLACRPAQVDKHCNEIVPLGQNEMDQGFRSSRGFRSPNQTLHQRIKNAYQLQLRGKTLFQMLNRFLNARRRRPKHSTLGLYEIAFKMTLSHPLIDRLIGEIERTIAGHIPPNQN